MADVLMAYQAYLALTLHWQSELASPAPVEPKKLAQRIIERTNKGIAVNESALTVQVDYLRVAARLPHGHAVTEALFGFHKVAANHPRPDEPLTPEGVEAMRASSDDLWTAQGVLIEACRATIGSQLPSWTGGGAP